MAMTTRLRPNPRLREDYAWTPRQREVLSMLAKGYSNGRIADELGVSLDGAKWHVREIMSKLGVDSRDEAAEYWRAYNGFGLRFSRLFRGLVGGAALKWAAGVAGTAVVGMLAAGVVAAVLLRTEEEVGEGGRAGSPVPTVAVPDATGGPTAPSGPRALSLAQPVQSVPGAVLYTVTGCFQCDGPDESLQRHVTTRSGQLITTGVLVPGRGPLEGWTLGAVDAAPDGRLLLAVTCDRQSCSALGPGEPGTRWRVIGSTDGGISWQPLFEMAGKYVEVSSVSAHGFVALVLGNDDERTHAAVSLVDRGARPVVAPGGAGEFPAAVLLADGRVLWVETAAGRVTDDEGTAIDLELPPGFSTIAYHGVRPLAGGGFAVSLVNYTDGQYREELFLYDDSFALLDSARSSPAFRMVAASAKLALGNATGPDLGIGSDYPTVYPVIVDLEGGHLTPVTAPVFTEQRGRNRFIAVQAGTFAVTRSGTDCLNVRESAGTGAPIVACVPDGTLLADAGETKEAGGATWLAVTLPDGRPGWVATEFVAR